MRVEVLDEIYSKRLIFHPKIDNRSVSYGYTMDENKHESVINLVHNCNKQGIGFIYVHKNRVRCKLCKKIWNISPERLIFMSKIARFGK